MSLKWRFTCPMKSQMLHVKFKASRQPQTQKLLKGLHRFIFDTDFDRDKHLWGTNT